MSELSVTKGSCLCKAVSLSTTSMNPHVAACHCNMFSCFNPRASFLMIFLANMGLRPARGWSSASRDLSMYCTN